MSTSGSHERFVTQYVRAEPELRAFVRSLLPRWEDVDEVLQNVALTAWRKIDQLEHDANFLPWACVIARFEVLNYRRTKARERLSFRQELVDMLAEEGIAEIDRRRDERRALDACMQRLPENKRDLVRKVYTPGVRVVDVADGLQRSAGSVYTMLNRIRQDLLDCVQRTLAEESF